MRKHLYSILALLLFSLSVQAQRASYFRRIFVDAEYYFLYEDYRDALPLYMELLESSPDNANVQYRIGLCYLNIPNEKHKSIPFFERAQKAINHSYSEGYFTETQAPPEVFLYYGQALRITGELDKAREAFVKYSEMVKDDSDKLRVVSKEVESLNYAQQLMAQPINLTYTSAGRTVNTRFSEINPVVSADTSIMIYTSVQQFYNAILQSNQRASIWSHPININSQLYADGEITTVGMSSDGKTILFARNDNDVFNLYIATYDGAKQQWSPLSRLPKEINSRSWETYATFSPSGDTLYFSSNRPGGFGGFDIYYSVLTPSGWSEAVNLGASVNTQFDEIAPALTHNGKRLFFSSTGHKTMGGYDTFVTERKGQGWGKPVNLGYPFNTTDDDIFFQPIGDGSAGFLSRILPQSFGGFDIYLVEFDLDSILSR
ncbi:PD40 domain-containing protein [Perlabentimonas gracilis]|uniref:PD40 domain-containing protein n=1 Tax=Perlabentimonas gracilis TaxID=2715279 RepID=UPI00140A91C9|nr:PD40 domain-containing protein [Perlabentimonas gracilis]NHB70385.1 hypothetical protein [Perlabentimonas gracilis]